MSKLDLYLLGTPRIEIDGQTVHIARRKATALFAYLALTGVRHNRDALATLLWPEKGQSSARAELRRALYFINKALGNQWLQTDLETAGLSSELNDSTSGKFWLDVAEFQQQLNACENHKHAATETCPDCIPHLEAAVELYTDHFMAGFSLSDCPEFDEWQFFQAEGLRGQLASALLRLSSFYTSASRQDFETAIRYARIWVNIDPLHEPSHRQLMRLYALSSQKAAALRQFELLKHSLEAELSVTPSDETVELFDRIRDGEFQTGPYATSKSAEQQDKPTHNLSRQLTSFIGREAEIQQVVLLLEGASQVTVIGHGGIGKTRLAIEVSHAVLDRFPDGVWLVDLAPLSDSEKVAQTAARAVGIPVDTGSQALEALLDYLRPRQMLLVLDNCEHLIEASAQLAEAVLENCPQVNILATSREPLGTIGETVYYLPSLSIPSPGDIPELEQIMQFEAIELFASRASAVHSQFAITAHNKSDIAKVCAQLDGIPLAIELAAAWVRILPVDQINFRLSENIDFLRSSNRTTLPRHQTLRACLDWSYDLLTPSEKDLLQALSVFAGSWTLEAVEAVFAEGHGSQFEVLETLDQLAAKSLVIVEHQPEIETRYRLLEPVRQYASEKLHYAGNAVIIRDRHLAYFQNLVVRAKPHLRAHKQIEWLCRLERELENIRAALDWAYSEHGPMQRLERGLQIASDLRWFWQCRHRHLEGFQWLRRLLDLEQQRRGDQPYIASMCQVRAWALTLLVDLTQHIRFILDTNSFNWRANLDESLALFSQLGEAGKSGLCYTRFIQLREENRLPLEDKLNQLRKICTEFEDLGEKFNMAHCTLYTGMVLYDLDKPVLCETYLQKALSLCQEVGDRDMTPFVWALLGHTAVLQGNLDDAIVCASEAVNILKAVGNVLLSSATLSYKIVGELFWQLGDYRQAEKCYQTAIAKVRDQDLTMESKISLCCIAMSQGNYSKARYLLDDLRQSIRGKEHSWTYTFFVRVYAELEWGMGNFSQAGIWLNELQKVIRASNYQRYNNFHKTSAELGFAKVALSKSDWEAAAEHIQCALNIQMEIPIYYRHLFEDKYAAVYLAAVFSLWLDKPDEAARLLGAANQSYQVYRLTFPLFRRQLIDQTIEDTRTALDEETFTTAWEAGKAMDLNEALAYALEVVEEIQVSSHLGSGVDNDLNEGMS